MRRCVWCRKYKNPAEIKFTIRQYCCCTACADFSKTRQEETLKAALRDEIVRVLRRDGELSAAELAAEIGDTNGRKIGTIAPVLLKEGKIDREPHPTERRLWLWKALPDAPPPKPKIGRPKKKPEPPPVVVADPEFKPAPMMPQAESAVEIKFQKLKRSTESSVKGITDEDLLWQAKYRAQKEWREQRAMN